MKLLFTLLGGLVVFSGQAQQPLPPTRVATHADSIATLRQVFRQSRRLTRGSTLTSGLLIGFGVAELTTPSTSTARQALSLGTLGISTAYAVQGIVNWRRYSKRREQEAVQRFDQHQPQPLYVQRRLVFAFKR